jgi:hypothetical protein
MEQDIERGGPHGLHPLALINKVIRLHAESRKSRFDGW